MGGDWIGWVGGWVGGVVMILLPWGGGGGESVYSRICTTVWIKVFVGGGKGGRGKRVRVRGREESKDKERVEERGEELRTNVGERMSEGGRETEERRNYTDKNIEKIEE